MFFGNQLATSKKERNANFTFRDISIHICKKCTYLIVFCLRIFDLGPTGMEWTVNYIGVF